MTEKVAQRGARAPGSTSGGQAVSHLSVREREAMGKDARVRAHRASQAEFEPTSSRPDPVELLEGQSQGRVQELVPIRYGRMLVSAFTFYRGAALLMASDLATTPNSGLKVQLCGDAHLSNFGLFASPERALMFDVNDFDETLPGPWEWDVKRLAASAVIAARDQEFTAKEARTAAIEVGASLPTGDGTTSRNVHARRLVLPHRCCAAARRPSDGSPHHRVEGRQAHGKAQQEGSWTRPVPGTACRPSANSLRWSTASAGS